MKAIAYTRPDGGISICHPVISKDDPKGFTEEQALERALKKDIPADATNVQVIEKNAIPNDRTFRDAWAQNGKAVHVDMPKARELHMGRLRKMRNEKLDQLDKDFNRASGQKKQAEADAIEAKRQRLRDMPATFDLSAAKTPDELKAMMPEDLK